MCKHIHHVQRSQQPGYDEAWNPDCEDHQITVYYPPVDQPADDSSAALASHGKHVASYII